mgnify:CR=1 FL=1
MFFEFRAKREIKVLKKTPLSKIKKSDSTKSFFDKHCLNQIPTILTNGARKLFSFCFFLGWFLFCHFFIFNPFSKYAIKGLMFSQIADTICFLKDLETFQKNLGKIHWKILDYYIISFQVSMSIVDNFERSENPALSKFLLNYNAIFSLSVPMQNHILLTYIPFL